MCSLVHYSPMALAVDSLGFSVASARARVRRAIYSGMCGVLRAQDELTPGWGAVRTLEGVWPPLQRRGSPRGAGGWEDSGGASRKHLGCQGSPSGDSQG